MADRKSPPWTRDDPDIIDKLRGLAQSAQGHIRHDILCRTLWNPHGDCTCGAKTMIERIEQKLRETL
jgi:hypothetical protein